MIRKRLWNEKIGKSDEKRKVGKSAQKNEVKKCENVQTIKIELKSKT